MDHEQYFSVKMVDGEPKTSGQTKCFLGHIVNPGPDPEREGIFVEWEWDGKALRVKTDRFALYPVYYWCEQQRFAISTSMMKLFDLGVPQELDYAGLSVFMRLGFHIGEKTCFKGIKALPPDVDLQWSRGQLSLKTRLAIEKPNRINKDDAIDKYIHLFSESIRKRAPQGDPFVLPISGGRDSRHILLELLRQGHKPESAVTYEQFSGKSFGEDIRIGAALCEELGIRHVRLQQTEKYLAAELKKNVHTGFNTDENQQMYVLADYMPQHTHITYDGIAGGIFTEGSFRWPSAYRLYQGGRYEELAVDTFEKFSCHEENFRRLFREPFYAKINIDQAVMSLTSELKRHETAADPFASFLFWNRTRREISLLPYRALERVPVVYAPYLDYELNSFLSSLPLDILTDNDFHTQTIRRAYPQYAHIPFENEGIVRDRSVLNKKTSEIIRQVAFYYLSQFKFNEPVWDQQYLFPRMLRCLCSASYAASLRWLPMARVLFLTQLINSGGLGT